MKAIRNMNRLPVVPRTMMNKLTMIFLLCVHTGCASKPLQVSDKEEQWPHAVDRTCPDRKVLPECFRRQDIDLAMRRLLPFIQNCLQQAGDSTLVKLTVETKDGRPSCIEHRLNGNETAECVAGAVARELLLPDSPTGEHCRFNYPVRLRGPRE